MLHTTNNIVVQSAIRILQQADKVLEQNRERLFNLDRDEPGMNLWSRIGYLQKNLEAQIDKYKAIRVLWTEGELRTLASALAVVDWENPSVDDSDRTSVRFLTEDHLGIKNVGR